MLVDMDAAMLFFLYEEKYMPNFCILAVYLHLDNIRQGIYE
jgi:hypothetical protein